MNSLNTLTDNLSYEAQKAIIRAETNQSDPNWFPDLRMFRKDKKEKEELYNLKMKYRDRMREKYPNWTKHNSSSKQYLEIHDKFSF